MVQTIQRYFIVGAFVSCGLLMANPTSTLAQSANESDWLNWNAAVRNCAVTDILARTLAADRIHTFGAFTPAIMSRRVDGRGRFRVLFGDTENLNGGIISRVVSVEIIELSSQYSGGEEFYRRLLERTLLRQRVSGESAARCVSQRSAEIGFSVEFEGGDALTTFFR